MNLGYDQTLYLLPFDHRESYVKGLFDFQRPLTAQQHDEYGAEFASHIEAFDPTFAKVLVRYNPEGAHALNLRQADRLRMLSEHCQQRQCRFMFELLVPATAEQLARTTGGQAAYDRRLRPTLMCMAIRALQDAGVEPDVWKVEGLMRRDDCERIAAAARHDGRGAVGCIVLGRGADPAKVRHWLTLAAKVDGFIGFVVGRTTFWDAVAAYRAQTMTRAQAVAQIARRLREWVDIFEQARLSRVTGVGQVPPVLP